MAESVGSLAESTGSPAGKMLIVIYFGRFLTEKGISPMAKPRFNVKAQFYPVK
jgi:hypothetical protein